MAKELVPVKNYNLQVLEGEVMAVFQEELDGLGAIPFDYIKIPSGGGIAFEVPGDDPDSPDLEKKLKGIMLHHHPINSYWMSSELSNEAPDCQSNDGKLGIVKETGEVRDCATCPHNQFKEDGSGKECKNSHRIYFLREGEPMPVIITLPPTSLRPLKDYIAKRLLLKGRRPIEVVTEISLKKEQNKDGVTFAMAQFLNAGLLDPTQKEKALKMQGYIKEIAGLVPAVDEAGNGAQQQTETKKPNLDIEYSDEPAEQPFAEGEEEPTEFEEV